MKKKILMLAACILSAGFFRIVGSHEIPEPHELRSFKQPRKVSQEKPTTDEIKTNLQHCDQSIKTIHEMPTSGLQALGAISKKELERNIRNFEDIQHKIIAGARKKSTTGDAIKPRLKELRDKITAHSKCLKHYLRKNSRKHS